MKTPRDLLLTRHAAASPRLDELRAAVLAEMRAAKDVIPSQSLGTTLWQQLVIACRPAWVVLGAAWGLIFLLNTTSTTMTEHPDVAVASRFSPEVEVMLKAQRQLWVELTTPANPLPPRAKQLPATPPGAMLPRDRRIGWTNLA
jgi:hypothetical protein